MSQIYYSTNFYTFTEEEVNVLKTFNYHIDQNIPYRVRFKEHPCDILNKLETLGYNVITSSVKTDSRTVIWTLQKSLLSLQRQPSHAEENPC